MLDIMISVFFLMFTCVMYAKTMSIPGASKWDFLGSRYFPRIILIFMVAISLMILILSIRNYVRVKRNSTKDEQKFLYKYKEIMVIFLSMFLYLAGFNILGFFFGSIIFLTFLQWYLTEGAFSYKNLLISLISVAVIYFIFSKFLNVLLPAGVFELGL